MRRILTRLGSKLVSDQRDYLDTPLCFLIAGSLPETMLICATDTRLPKSGLLLCEVLIHDKFSPRLTCRSHHLSGFFLAIFVPTKLCGVVVSSALSTRYDTYKSYMSMLLCM